MHETFLQKVDGQSILFDSAINCRIIGKTIFPYMDC